MPSNSIVITFQEKQYFAGLTFTLCTFSKKLQYNFNKIIRNKTIYPKEILRNFESPWWMVRVTNSDKREECWGIYKYFHLQQFSFFIHISFFLHLNLGGTYNSMYGVSGVKEWWTFRIIFTFISIFTSIQQFYHFFIKVIFLLYHNLGTTYNSTFGVSGVKVPGHSKNFFL